LVIAELKPLVEAQLASARGLKHLLFRNKKTGKFEHVTGPTHMLRVLNDESSETYEIWARDPSTQAFADLMNRALDKPVEALTLEHAGEIRIRWMGEDAD
jgi:hypothetical protein